MSKWLTICVLFCLTLTTWPTSARAQCPTCGRSHAFYVPSEVGTYHFPPTPTVVEIRTMQGQIAYYYPETIHAFATVAPSRSAPMTLDDWVMRYASRPRSGRMVTRQTTRERFR